MAAATPPAIQKFNKSWWPMRLRGYLQSADISQTRFAALLGVQQARSGKRPRRGRIKKPWQKRATQVAVPQAFLKTHFSVQKTVVI
jgi:hypothetical protein